jgi:hypothetical protein
MEAVKSLSEVDFLNLGLRRDLTPEGQKESTWDGPRTPAASKLINEAHEVEHRQKKKVTR